MATTPSLLHRPMKGPWGWKEWTLFGVGCLIVLQLLVMVESRKRLETEQLVAPQHGRDERIRRLRSLPHGTGCLDEARRQAHTIKGGADEDAIIALAEGCVALMEQRRNR